MGIKELDKIEEGYSTARKLFCFWLFSLHSSFREEKKTHNSGFPIIRMFQIVSLVQKAFIQLSNLNRGSHSFKEP